MIIPFNQLGEDTLIAVIEDFVSREGTDYGEVEATFGEKVDQVLRQLESGEALISFDEATESCSIVLAKSIKS